MYIDNIGQEFVIGSTPCNDGITGPTGMDGTSYFVKYYEIESVDTPLKGPGDLTEIIINLGDDGFAINPPPFSFDGIEYYEMYILITGLIYFQPWDVVLDGYDAGNPSIPCLFINAHAQFSMQRMYYGLEENDTQLRIRYEGTNEPEGIIGEPNIVWELTFYYNIPGQIDIVFGELTPPNNGVETLTAISTGQGFLGQLNGVSNTAYRIYPAQQLVSSINIKGDGFRTGIKDDILYIDVDPLHPLTNTYDGSNSTIISPNLLNIESSSLLRIEGGTVDVHTLEYSDDLNPNYYGDINISPGNGSDNGLTFLADVLLENVPQYNSNSIPTGPEYLVWVDENNFLRVL